MPSSRKKLRTWNVNGLSKKLKDEDVYNSRQKAKKKGRPNGGIICLYKAMYKSHVECIPCGHEDLLIVRLNGQAIGHDRDLYLINVYVRQDVTLTVTQ